MLKYFFLWRAFSKKIISSLLLNKYPERPTRSSYTFQDVGNKIFLAYSNDTKGKINGHIWIVFGGILRYDFYYSDDKYNSFVVSGGTIGDTMTEKLLFPLVFLVLIVKGKKLAEFTMEQVNLALKKMKQD